MTESVLHNWTPQASIRTNSQLQCHQDKHKTIANAHNFKKGL